MHKLGDHLHVRTCNTYMYKLKCSLYLHAVDLHWKMAFNSIMLFLFLEPEQHDAPLWITGNQLLKNNYIL